MILLEAAEIINKNLKAVAYDSKYTNNANNQTFYQASNLSRLREAINNLSIIPYVKHEIDLLHRSWLFNTNSDTMIISSEDNSSVQNTINRIAIGLQFILRIAEATNTSRADNVIYIKLPDLKSFDDLSKIATDFKKGVELPINDGNVGDVNILTAESGSIWLIVSLGATTAVNLIAGICWAAAVIRKKNAEAKIFEHHAKTLELKNEALDSIIGAQKTQLTNILTSEAEAIANKHYNISTPETIERLKLSITTIADLIDRGAQILPASPDPDITKSFPNYSNLDLIESSIKQLTSNNK